jgi:hypothetical protein
MFAFVAFGFLKILNSVILYLGMFDQRRSRDDLLKFVPIAELLLQTA